MLDLCGLPLEEQPSHHANAATVGRVLTCRASPLKPPVWRRLRRDFANGFLVAEILSRYFPKEVEMHSFDTGISIVKKRDNWALLDKFLKVRQTPCIAPPRLCGYVSLPCDLHALAL